MSFVEKFSVGVIGLIVGEKARKVITGVGLAVLGAMHGNFGLVATGLSYAASGLVGKPKAPTNALDRLNATLDPHAERKFWAGFTAGGTDVRYQAATGDDQEYIEWVMASAAHECEGDFEIWFDTRKAWSQAGGVESDFDNYLEVTPVNPGDAGNGIAIDAVWTDACTLTGCAYFHLKFKLTGNSKKAESPFAQSLPSRVTVRGRGALVPDLRESGCEADDQTTWAWFSDDSGRNPAWQLLYYLIGWRIGGKLSVGRGLPVDRLDLDSFIAAANHCDEAITLAGSGTEPRYRSDALFSEDDDPSTVTGNLLTSMNAILRDNGGKLAVFCIMDDLATPEIDFTEADILGDDTWDQTPPVDEYFNVVRGRFVDASDEALYQLNTYPEIEVESVDDIERIDTFDLLTVQSASQAQRLAKHRLYRNLYRGVWSATYSHRAWQARVGMIVTQTLPALEWVEKVFRVASHNVDFSGRVNLVLREENEAIYAWDGEELPPPVVVAPIPYDPTLSPVIVALDVSVQNTIALSGPTGLTISATDAGGTVTVVISNHARDYMDIGSVPVTGTTLTGLPLSQAVGIFYDDPDREGGAVTWQTTATLADSVNSAAHPGRHHLTVVFVGPGQTTTPGTPAPGGGVPQVDEPY